MKYSIRLNKTEIVKLKNDLKIYTSSLKYKCQVFEEKLFDIGINVATFRLSRITEGDTPRDFNFGVKIAPEGDIVKGVLTLSGVGILFWEFGSGIMYNGYTSPNPKAKELGYDIGSYPNQTHVPDPGYWYYKDGGKWKRSVGTKAAMPMFYASEEMAEKIEEVAREVFFNV